MTSGPVTSVVVVGAGYMGCGIAQTLAIGGVDVALVDRDPGLARANLARTFETAGSAESRGLLAEGSAAALAARLTAADDPGEALARADLVVEAVPEDLDLKRDVLAEVERAVSAQAILATNTSAIPITAIASALERPERFFGIHWYNPAPYLPGIEVILGERSDAALLPPVLALLRAAGKDPVEVPDTPGFVGNRLQFALFREAAAMVEEGLVTPEQVDTVVRSSFGYRLPFFGPFAIADMAGLDVYAAAYATLEAGLGDRFSIPPSLRERVAAGDLGLKSGGGYLGLGPEDAAAMVERRDAWYVGLGRLRDQQPS